MTDSNHNLETYFNAADKKGNSAGKNAETPDQEEVASFFAPPKEKKTSEPAAENTQNPASAGDAPESDKAPGNAEPQEVNKLTVTEEDPEESGLNKRNHRLKKQKRKRALIIVLAVLFSLILAAAISAVVIFHHFYSRSNYVEETTASVTESADEIVVELIESNAMETFPESDAEEIVTLSPEEEEELRRKNELTLEEIPQNDLQNIYNLLLIGVDRRERNWNGNSDAMILVTINSNTNTIYLTSFMRDLYANIPGVGVRKLNHAFAVGGAPLLIDTLQSNYGVVINNYAWVDFMDLEAIINILGGVTLEIKDYEVPGLQFFGIYDIPGPGVYNLNGAQALAYTRIRYYGNSDFERTERQRRIIQLLMDKARNMGVIELTNTADAVLPYVTHNLTPTDTLNLISSVPALMNYQVQELRIPFDGDYTAQSEILIPLDINNTVAHLRSIIYAQQPPAE